MTVIFCDKCKKELKDSDDFWVCENWNAAPWDRKKHICAGCMREFMKEDEKK